MFTPPPSCINLDTKSSYYDPAATWDHCVDGAGNIKIAFECTNDTQCIEFATSEGDWGGSPAGAKCNSSCRYPVIGCMDDGRIDALAPSGTFYENNQGSMGHVLRQSYKCTTADGHILSFGNDSTCSRTLSGVVGFCVGSSGEVLLEYSNENLCLDESDNYDWPRSWEDNIECVDECLKSNSSAINYIEGSTYDPYGQCVYGGCVDLDAMNYAVPDTSDEYGCIGDECETWITDASCVIPFDFQISSRYYKIF